MPCSSEGYPNLTLERLDEVTRLLCEAIALLGDKLQSGSLGLRAWAEEHERQDREEMARLSREEAQRMLRREAFAKLTPDERAALGIRDRDGG